MASEREREKGDRLEKLQRKEGALYRYIREGWEA